MPGRVERYYRQHRASTVFLRVPSQDWIKVTRGQVTEFRAALGNAPRLFGVPLPTLCVAYRRRKSMTPDSRLMILEGVREEALAAITDEGLERAGYTGAKARDLFRRDWMIANKRKFEPMRKMIVFTVQPYSEDRLGECSAAIVHHLYGEFIAEATGSRERLQYVQT